LSIILHFSVDLTPVRTRAVVLNTGLFRSLHLSLVHSAARMATVSVLD